MKLSKYIKLLTEQYNKHGDLDCYYATDDEGNFFERIKHEPTVCEIQDNEPVIPDDSEDDITINAIIVN